MVTLDPYALRCEHRTTPLGIGEPRPRLAWQLASGHRGQRQTGYRVRLGGWDTGPVVSTEQQVVYAGPPLATGTRYRWGVTVWDAGGTEAGSAESWFETGLLHPTDWQAEWIGPDPAHAAPREPPGAAADGLSLRTRRLAPCPHLRRRFVLPGRPVRGRLYATARGLYELRLGGARVGDHELAPGWTDYRVRIHHQTYGVTDALVEGENVLGAVLADGWWCGYVGMDPRRAAQHYGVSPQLLARLVVDLADGTRQVVVTDRHWRDHPGPIRHADLLMGERYEAGRELGRWDRPGYDDRRWHPVQVLGSDVSPVVPAVDEPVRVTGEHPPVAVAPRGAGRFLVDFGQNLVGRVQLTVRGATAGQRIVLRHAEVLDRDLAAGGELYTANLRTAEATDTYVAAGPDPATWHPRFTVHGFRYVEVTGYPGELAATDLVAQVLGSDVRWVGEFSCSDPQVRRLHDNIRWSLRGNLVSVPTDCPQRDERLGWTADAQVVAPTATYHADLAAFFTKWLADLRDGQGPAGDFPDVAPRLVQDGPGAPGWGDAGVILPWQLYRSYGDDRLLAVSLDSMVAWVEWVTRHNPDLVWRHRTGRSYGDWLQVGARTPDEVLATAYFAHSADLVSRAARVLGREEVAHRYAGRFREIRDAFCRELVDADGTVAGDTQTGYLLALGFDLLPPELVPAAVDKLVANLQRHGRKLTTGFHGVAQLCPVLTAYGHADLAYDLLHQPECPSWIYPVRHGATTIWERWDGWTEEHGFQSAHMNSFNHYALGSVGEWLFREVAGIGQADDSAGFRDLVIRPHPGGRLRWAQARYDSVRGPVRCEWELTGDRLRLAVDVPPGATATVHVPTTAPHEVQEGGRPVAGRPDLTIVEPVGTVVELAGPALVCRVGSGSYRFTSGYQVSPQSR